MPDLAYFFHIRPWEVGLLTHAELGVLRSALQEIRKPQK